MFRRGRRLPQEIAKLGAFPDYRYNPELAADPRMARYEPGVSLYLASGTDVEDVKREAEALAMPNTSTEGSRVPWATSIETPSERFIERLLRGVDAADEASPGSKGEYISSVGSAVMSPKILSRITDVSLLPPLRAIIAP